METGPKKITSEMASEIKRINFELRKKRKELKDLETENPDVAIRTDDAGNARVYNIGSRLAKKC